MPNPTLIHPKNHKIDHHLKIVDTWLHFGCPERYDVEPDFGDYLPDAYMKDRMGNPICVEVQRSLISMAKMQKKVDQFISTFEREHDAKIMLLVTDHEYRKLSCPDSFQIIQIPLPKEPYE